MMTAQQIEFAEAWTELYVASRERTETLSQRDRLALARRHVPADDQAVIVLRLTSASA